MLLMCLLQQHVLGEFADPAAFTGAGGGGGAPGKPLFHNLFRGYASRRRNGSTILKIVSNVALFF